jgi:branched-chain amino acid transport system permease protein
MRDALCASEPGIGLAIQMIVLCLVALSAWLVLRVGRISLGQQAYFGIGAYGAALLTTVGQWPLDAALLAATLSGAIAAALMSWPLLRLPGLQYAVASLAVAELVRLGLSGWQHQVPGPSGTRVGPDGVHGFREIRWLFDHQVSQSDYLLWASAVLTAVVLALLALSRTRLGLAMKMVGHDETLAASQGLPVHRLRLLATALAGGVAAFAGGLYAHQLTYIEPGLFDPMLGIHAVGYSMLGGLATPLGPLLGAAFDLGLLEATRWFEGWRMVLFGTLVAVFLRWRPRGLLDEAMVCRLRSAWRARSRRHTVSTPVAGQP